MMSHMKVSDWEELFRLIHKVAYEDIIGSWQARASEVQVRAEAAGCQDALNEFTSWFEPCPDCRHPLCHHQENMHGDTARCFVSNCPCTRVPDKAGRIVT